MNIKNIVMVAIFCILPAYVVEAAIASPEDYIHVYFTNRFNGDLNIKILNKSDKNATNRVTFKNEIHNSDDKRVQ